MGGSDLIGIVVQSNTLPKPGFGIVLLGVSQKKKKIAADRNSTSRAHMNGM